jgi:hypothetical protein
MAINHNIDWEIKSAGTVKSGAGFNSSNSNAGLNYSYGNNYQLVTISDLEIDHADLFKPGIPSWTLSNGGTFPGGTYYIGVRYVALGGNGEIVATSELVEYADFIPSGKTVLINSPADPGYPFDHYQVFIRELAGSTTYAQLQDYGGGEVSSSVGTNLSLNSFNTSFTNILVANLPDKGNVFQLGSTTRNFVTNDIGNFIYLENNNIGFRSRAATEVNALNFVEIGKTNNYLYAAWFDLSESHVVKQISAVLWAQGSPSGDLFLELRTDNAGAPSSTILDYNSVNASSLSSTPQWLDISVNSNLSAGRYWIVVNFDTTPSATNYVKLGRKTSTGFQNLNDHHLFEYNTSTLSWSNVDTGTAVAIGVLWNTTDVWGDGDYSPFLLNKGSVRFEVLNVSSGQALVCSDYYLADIGSTNGKCYLGGASNNLFQVNEHASELNFHSLAHLQSGNYTLLEPLTLSHMSLSGYEVSHYDLGDKAVFIVDDGVDPLLYDYTTGLGAINITGNAIQIGNIEIDGSDFADKLITATNKSLYIYNCWFHNCTHTALYFGSGSSQVIWVESTRIGNILTESALSAGIYVNSANHLKLDTCFFENIAGCGVYANDMSLKVEFCIFHDIFGSLTNNGHAIIADECTDVKLTYLTVNNCTKSGAHLRKTGSTIISNCLFTNGGDHGILIDMDYPLAFNLSKIYNNAFFNNAGNQLEVNPPYLIQTGAITLTESPYVHIGNDYLDFTLNSATGSGENLIGKAYPSVFYGTNSLQILDIGAVQSFGNQPEPRRNPTVSLY